MEAWTRRRGPGRGSEWTDPEPGAVNQSRARLSRTLSRPRRASSMAPRPTPLLSQSRLIRVSEDRCSTLCNLVVDVGRSSLWSSPSCFRLPGLSMSSCTSSTDTEPIHDMADARRSSRTSTRMARNASPRPNDPSCFNRPRKSTVSKFDQRQRSLDDPPFCHRDWPDSPLARPLQPNRPPRKSFKMAFAFAVSNSSHLSSSPSSSSLPSPAPRPDSPPLSRSRLSSSTQRTNGHDARLHVPALPHPRLVRPLARGPDRRRRPDPAPRPRQSQVRPSCQDQVASSHPSQSVLSSPSFRGLSVCVSARFVDARLAPSSMDPLSVAHPSRALPRGLSPTLSLPNTVRPAQPHRLTPLPPTQSSSKPPAPNSPTRSVVAAAVRARSSSVAEAAAAAVLASSSSVPNPVLLSLVAEMVRARSPRAM